MFVGFDNRSFRHGKTFTLCCLLKQTIGAEECEKTEAMKTRARARRVREAARIADGEASRATCKKRAKRFRIAVGFKTYESVFSCVS